MTETEMVRAIVSEMRATELVTALRHAVGGAPHWRWEAQRLLSEIDALMLPVRAAEMLRDRDDCKKAAEILNDVCND